MPRIQFTPRLVIGSILLIIPFVVFIIGMTLTFFASGEKQFSARRTDTSAWDAGAAPTVEVDLVAGSITVSQAADGRVTAKLVKFAVTDVSRAAADAALDDIAVTAVQEGTLIRIKATAAPRIKLSQLKADLDLRVPGDASLDLVTGEGLIAIGKVDEAGYGTYLASSPVALRAVKARDLGQTDVGIEAELAPRPALPPTALDLASRRGPVVILGDNVLINAAAEAGAIQFTGRPAPGVHHLRTGSAAHQTGQLPPGIRLTLPADSAFEIDAQSQTGLVASEFAADPPTTPGGRALQGVVGVAPRVKLELRTVAGPIEIRKAPGGTAH